MEMIDQVVLETDPIDMMEHSGHEEDENRQAEVMEHSGQEGKEGSNIKYSPGAELELPQCMFQFLKPQETGFTRKFEV